MSSGPLRPHQCRLAVGRLGMLTSDFSWVFWAEEPNRAMKVFVSYSSHDDVAVRSLVADLERARQQVWLDQDLGGGDAWWAVILEQIRACTVFMFALSNNSLYSTPCRAELDYAKSLRLPILPVQIGEVGSYRTDPIFQHAVRRLSRRGQKRRAHRLGLGATRARNPSRRAAGSAARTTPDSLRVSATSWCFHPWKR